ncbi:G-protein coupled receptor family C group 5 member B-like [Paramormyrops kingsleyae]|uniref:G-protein coupled receptor family C group 5 member B-like n=1 Tax=Paramormyrops kingsleyae TaxID=1676925 RepID=UPI000CD63E5D|nr:G-protein coupled receptor family C group 5 member B-like [Paramormyrops kingsleyae]
MDETSPRGCGSLIKRPYTALCDLDAVWGVAVASAAGGAALASMILALVLLCRLRKIMQDHSRVAPLLLLLAAVIGLCGLSIAFLIERNEPLCIARRAFWGVLSSLSFACLVAQCVRLHRLARGARSPSGGALVGLAVALAVLDPEWMTLTEMPQGLEACQYKPLDLTVACTYVLVLLLSALVGAAYGLCRGQPQLRRSAVWLLLTCLASALLWAAWLTFFLYGSAELGLSSIWDDRAQAVVLVAQSWLLLLLHAAPEAHATLQSPLRIREATIEEGIPLPHLTVSQGVPILHSTSAPSGSQQNGSV